MVYYEKIKAVLFGVAIGDALGLSVQFGPREVIKETPVVDMEGYGVFFKPPGYFSDDSSLTFALVEALINEYNLDNIAENFVKWLDEGFWTPDGEAFDIGSTTFNSINNLKEGIKPTVSGETHERSNGNGSLMRIAPLIFIIKDKPIEERFQIIKEVSSITHRHTRSVIACFYYLEFLR
jgi:ADP-ribosylglycohydrolase